MINNFHGALLLHPQGAHDDIMDDTIDVVPGVGLVFPIGKLQRANSLGFEFNRLAPELGLGVHRSVEDEVGGRVARRPLRGVRVAAVRVKGRDGRVVADLKDKQTNKFEKPYFFSFFKTFAIFFLGFLTPLTSSSHQLASVSVCKQYPRTKPTKK